MANPRDEAHARQVAAQPTVPSPAPAPTAPGPIDPQEMLRRVATFVGVLGGDDYGVDPKAPPPQGMPDHLIADAVDNSNPARTAALADAQIKGLQPPTQKQTGGDMLYSGSFAHDLLAALNMPVTYENIRFLQAWEKAETGDQGKGTPAFNPLATTQNYGSNTKFNSVGVKNYADYNTGVLATAQVMMNGHYAPILAALAQGNNAMNAARAVAETPWGTGTGVMRVLGGK